MRVTSETLMGAARLRARLLEAQERVASLALERATLERLGADLEADLRRLEERRAASRSARDALEARVERAEARMHELEGELRALGELSSTLTLGILTAQRRSARQAREIAALRAALRAEREDGADAQRLLRAAIGAALRMDRRLQDEPWAGEQISRARGERLRGESPRDGEQGQE
ncbi:MAG: hypothetical protein OEY14_12615 [Myxococcales bacterium]|nr:hypothetical protein [Myxococcales bacterium]